MASSTWPSPMPPHSSGMCGSQRPVLEGLLAERDQSPDPVPPGQRIRDLSPSAFLPSIRCSSGLMTSSTKVRTRMRISSSSGVREKSMAISRRWQVPLAEPALEATVVGRLASCTVSRVPFPASPDCVARRRGSPVGRARRRQRRDRRRVDEPSRPTTTTPRRSTPPTPTSTSVTPTTTTTLATDHDRGAHHHDNDDHHHDTSRPTTDRATRRSCPTFDFGRRATRRRHVGRGSTDHR